MAQIIHELQDMTYLSWAKTRNSSGTAGSFLKAYEEGTDGKVYYMAKALLDSILEELKPVS